MQLKLFLSASFHLFLPNQSHCILTKNSIKIERIWIAPQKDHAIYIYHKISLQNIKVDEKYIYIKITNADRKREDKSTREALYII